MTDQRPAELFAAYLEVVDESDAAHRRRRQWIILPQMPARLAPGDSPITDSFSWFEREQRNAKHRAVWSYKQDTDGLFRRNLPGVITTYTEAGWTASPMITCEIHPTELAQILKEKKTPYRIMARLAKVAKGMHRLDIS